MASLGHWIAEGLIALAKLLPLTRRRRPLPDKVKPVEVPPLRTPPER